MTKEAHRGRIEGICFIHYCVGSAFGSRRSLFPCSTQSAPVGRAVPTPISGARTTAVPRCPEHAFPLANHAVNRTRFPIQAFAAWRGAGFYRVLLRLVWERINMPNDRANHARPLNDGNVSGAETEKRGNLFRRVIAVLGQEWME